MAECLKYWDEGPARHVVLNRPERKNALSVELLGELEDAFTPPPEYAPKIAFLSGRGGAFSAGADLNDISGNQADAAYDERVTAVTQAIAGFPGLVVAVIEGPCIGAAVHLALACDLRIAEVGATVGVPATRLGLLYNPEAIAQLHRVVPAAALTRLLVLGETFSATDALAAGLVSEVLTRERLEARKNRLTERMVANDAMAVALTKTMLHELRQGSADMARWKQAYLTLLGGDSRGEAVSKAKAELGLAGAKKDKRAAS